MRVDADVRFAIIPEWVLDADISPQAVRLYGVLARFADNVNTCNPSRRKLAARMRCSVDTVDRSLRELESIGAVTKQAIRTDNGEPAPSLLTVRTAAPTQGVAASSRRPSRTDAARMKEVQDLGFELTDVESVSNVPPASGYEQRQNTTAGDIVAALNGLADRKAMPS